MRTVDSVAHKFSALHISASSSSRLSLPPSHRPALCPVLAQSSLNRPKSSPSLKAVHTANSEVSSQFLPRSNWRLADFEIAQVLGTGGYGKVQLARTKVQPNYIVALKTIRINYLVETGIERQIAREIEIQANLRHPNVLRLYGYFFDSSEIYLILELAPHGHLLRRLIKLGRFSDRRSARYISQVTDALMYLHSKNVIHRDIKPENILLDINGQIKLADFGWSVYTPGKRRRTTCGTADYMAPEMLEFKFYDKRVDNWAIGVLAFEFLTGSPPFTVRGNEQETQSRIRQVSYTVPDMISPEARKLIDELLQHDPRNRLPLPGVYYHPWLTKYRKPTSS